jgi:hypothetical protein
LLFAASAKRRPSDRSEPERCGAERARQAGQNLPAVRVHDSVVYATGSTGSSMAIAVVSVSIALLEACVHRKPGGVIDARHLVRGLRESALLKPWFKLLRAP